MPTKTYHKLVRDRIEQLQLVEKAIQDTSDAIQTQHTFVSEFFL